MSISFRRDVFQLYYLCVKNHFKNPFLLVGVCFDSILLTCFKESEISDRYSLRRKINDSRSAQKQTSQSAAKVTS